MIRGQLPIFIPQLKHKYVYQFKKEHYIIIMKPLKIL